MAPSCGRPIVVVQVGTLEAGEPPCFAIVVLAAPWQQPAIRVPMDRSQIEIATRAARERTGRVTPETVRETALDTGLAAELLAEQATTLAVLGRRLDEALASLVDGRAAAERDAAAGARWIAVREDYQRLRWEMLVVKEAMGLRGVRAEIDRTWPVLPPLRQGFGLARARNQ